MVSESTYMTAWSSQVQRQAGPRAEVRGGRASMHGSSASAGGGEVALDMEHGGWHWLDNTVNAPSATAFSAPKNDENGKLYLSVCFTSIRQGKQVFLQDAPTPADPRSSFRADEGSSHPSL